MQPTSEPNHQSTADALAAFETPSAVKGALSMERIYQGFHLLTSDEFVVENGPGTCERGGHCGGQGWADAGPLEYGTVDWEALTAGAGSVGVKEVYRVETAGGGGQPPASCEGFGETVLSRYAAMYWVYD
ncbi:hypothetical protein IMSHALPRED_006738 [Imshaugia aleurites]|uniref:Uncharacterized protein n=1 Tax=Imshaugia aleurites TaxID=172621 RepID=A0A8H3ISC5_9LECA|nr:hypothetical protein IMSHALPRED_006738 [Imshaugia aleurites]